VATQEGKTAVGQCKKSSSPVGNKAVQEAIAGRTYASADLAFVVSNAGFTPAAKALASKSGIHLLHYTSLPDLGSYLT
jgi:restriction system protein